MFLFHHNCLLRMYIANSQLIMHREICHCSLFQSLKMLRFERLFEESDGENHNRCIRDRKNYEISQNNVTIERFRLNKVQIEFVLTKIGDKLLRSEKNYALNPLQQLLTALHWMGNGGQYHGVGDMHGVSKATVCRVVHRVAEALVEVMLQDTVCWPTNSSENATHFLRQGGFPQVAGCIDGTVINIDAPIENEVHFVNRHGRHSLNVMMVCGPNRRYYSVNANWPGSVHDARILRNSHLFADFENGFRPFPNAVILGDSAYPLKEWLIPPIRRNPNDIREVRFNRAHKSTRRIVENSFGK